MEIRRKGLKMVDKQKGRKLQPFLDVPEAWENEWQDMPEFIQEDLKSYKALIVHFETKEDMAAFAKLLDQKITFKTPSIWYPKLIINHIMNKEYIDTETEE